MLSTNYRTETATRPVEFARYGAIHLRNTDLQAAVHFWTRVAGLTLRKLTGDSAELGTPGRTWVVVHEVARASHQEGFSGLYHFAIHAGDAPEFARMLYRLIVQGYPFSPVDHTMSLSLYLRDPDGIQVEFTLETPTRYKGLITEGGLWVVDHDGHRQAASAPLDVNEVLELLPGDRYDRPLSEAARIGHVHFYVADVPASFAFYQQLGFEPFNYLPAYRFADLGTGGVYRHRMALNAWHGPGRPPAPHGHAGMQHIQLVYAEKVKLFRALATLQDVEERDGGFWVHDPSGNRLLLTLEEDQRVADLEIG